MACLLYDSPKMTKLNEKLRDSDQVQSGIAVLDDILKDLEIIRDVQKIEEFSYHQHR
jgi:hypothetical protein